MNREGLGILFLPGIPDHHVANRPLHIGQVQFTPVKSCLYVRIRDLDLRLREHLLAPGDFRAEQFIRRCQRHRQRPGSFRLIDIGAGNGKPDSCA